jgi:hypothetical protein
MAKLFDAGNAPKKAFNIDDYLAHSYEELFAAEVTWRKNQRMPIAFEQSTSFFTGADTFSARFTF